MKTFFADRTVIENKYHIQNEPFDPYKRMAYHGYPFAPATGLDDAEICAGLDAMADELSALPHPIAKAKAVGYVLDHTRIDVNAHDWFIGLWSVNRLANRVCMKPWLRELYAGELAETRSLMDDLEGSNAAAIWPDFDHVVPDWEAILSLGFVGLRDRARAYHRRHTEAGTLTPAMDAHFRGIDILYGAILDLIDRLCRLAAAQTHDKAARIAACLCHIRDGAPGDIYEAMQTMYIYFMLSECFDSYQVRSLGNGLDQSLYRFYAADLAAGRYTRDEIRELLAYFLFQWSAIGNYWGQPFYMGGTNADGTTRYNDLSRDILAVYAELGIYNPKIQLKVNRNTPDDILFAAFAMIRRGQSCFTFCCEPGMMRAVMRYGATAEEARTMDIRGCYETGVRGNEVSTITGYVNALKPIELVLARPDLASLATFEDFYHAVLQAWGDIIEQVIRAANAYERYLGHVNPSLLYSSTIEGSLARGRDAYQDGVKFNNSAVLNCGMASLVDAVMAVRELVYETRTVTLAELKAALDADWAGYADLRTMARKCPHKYGNGDELADRYAEAMAMYFAMRVTNRPNARGGVYKACMHSAMQFVWQGEKTPATPDGRHAGDEISKNGSPSVGMDRNGVTALIRSALCMQPTAYPESFCLDVMLHPSAVEGEEGAAIMRALLMTYLEGGGMTIQFNVLSAATLRDAQADPERYRNLQVRVCGWNVLWNNLSRKEQEAYITRSENLQ